MKAELWEIFMALVRAGLWEKETDLPVVPGLTDWESLLEASRAQAVEGLLFRGVSHLPDSKMPPAQIRLLLMADADSIERNSGRIASVQDGVLKEFARHSLPAVVVKGTEAAKYYAFPALRESGDIDIYCPDFRRALELFPHAVPKPDGSASFVRDGVEVELHPRYFDLHLPDSRLPEVPSRAAELLMLSAHIFKHAAGAGIGLRQFCDMAAAMSHPYDHEQFREALSRARMLRWNSLLCSYLVEDLGLDPVHCGIGFARCNPSRLRKIVMDGGNFGFSGSLRSRSDNPGIRKAATALSLIRRIPFSVRYAPREAFLGFVSLVGGNLTRTNRT
ncbi:MAG: nucleotidyltransferase family protein [Bacteroidales bacterium]|nr:nucleotidyltransferase family protein [Bacteroidales bacterium]